MVAIPERLVAALADRHRLERELGAGGMATVYLALDLKHQRQVAVKVLRPDLAAALGAERFLREVGIAARLSHPHIVGLLDSGEADGFLYYVMPYVEGISLRQRLVREGELPIPEAVRILRDIADALAHAHRQGVVHRDIKPENVMLTGRHALVMDFGVAKALAEGQRPEGTKDPAAPLTSVGVALGTPAYMAPEQATGDAHVDARADIYAWGVVAYELLAGQPPFVRATPQATLAAHVTATAEPVTTHRPTVPGALAALVTQCLEKRAADRPQTAEEVVTRLEAVLTPSGGMTPTATQPYQTAAARRAQRRRAWRGAGAVTALTVLAVAAWRFWPRPAVDWVTAPRGPVAVVPFEVRGGGPELAGLGVQFADQVTAVIVQAGLAEVAPARPAATGSAVPADLGRIAEATGAATLVTGVITVRGDSVEVQAELVRAGDRKRIWILGPDRASVANIGAALGAIRERILGAAGTYFSPDATRADVSVWQPPPTLEIFRLLDRADALNGEFKFDEEIPLLEEAFQKDATYLPSVRRLHSALIMTRRWSSADSVRRYLEARVSQLTLLDRLDFEMTIAYYAKSPEDLYEAVRARARVDSSTYRYMLMYAAQRSGRAEEAIQRFNARDTTETWLAWEIHGMQAYHHLGRFEEELRVGRAARLRYPTAWNMWEREVRAMAALGWADSVTVLIAASAVLANPNADGILMQLASEEYGRHGHPALAAAMWNRYLTEYVSRFPVPRAQADLRRRAYTGLGRHAEVVALAREDARWTEGSPAGFDWRARWMLHTVMAGDTAGAAAMVDSLRTASVQLQAEGVNPKAWGLYTGAQILSALRRQGEAVVMLRQALNNGYRVNPDEELMWYWVPLRDNAGFQTLVRPRG